MNHQTDSQLLRAYAEKYSDPAFAELVRRYVDLVHSAALRMVCDAHLAQDVTQAVFLALAKNAAQLTSRPVLSGWLHRTAQNIAAQTVRTDVRRRAREQEAAAMNDLFSASSEASWTQIAPHLDTALSELGESERDALLLRYFERKSAREMAAQLGISDDAAQKRVSRAVERLREFFAKRGITVGASGLVVAISANAVQAAPAGLALSISTASALTGTTLATTATATKVIAMTAIQKTVVTATIAVLAGVGIYEARQASQWRDQVQALQQLQTPLTTQLERLNRALNDATSKLAALESDNERLNRNTAELLKLRSEAGRWRTDAQELARLQAGNNSDPDISEARAWRGRVNQLKQHLEQHPNAGIPELRLATDQDWLDAARDELKTEKDFRQAMSALRWKVTTQFANNLQSALRKYLDAHGRQFPTDLSQLQSYFDTPVDETILQRYAILPKDRLPNLGMGGDWIISQKAAVDEELDSRVGIGPHGWGSTGSQGWGEPIEPSLKLLEPAYKAYLAANSGREPGKPEEILPYLKTPEEREAYDKALKTLKRDKK